MAILDNILLESLIAHLSLAEGTFTSHRSITALLLSDVRLPLKHTHNHIEVHVIHMCDTPPTVRFPLGSDA